MQPAATPRRILVMGVSGSGKSTLAAALADRLGLPLIEADDWHSPQNVARMTAGTPLTDADRSAWNTAESNAAVGASPDDASSYISGALSIDKRKIPAD